MPKITGLDIPPGLITQYQSVLTLAFYDANATIKKRKYPVSYAKRISFANGSLFVKWQNLWGSFLAPRKLSWTDYWETLPFGAHSGTGGWPGSGYSAFIYVNAPRYMAGLELLLDPPTTWGTEICPDPYFANAGLWTLNNNCSISGGKLIFPSVAGEYLGDARIEIPMTFDLRERRIEFIVKIPAGLDGYIFDFESGRSDVVLAGGLYNDGGGQGLSAISFGTDNIPETYTKSFTFVFDENTTFLSFDVEALGDAGDIEVSYASFREEII